MQVPVHPASADEVRPAGLPSAKFYPLGVTVLCAAAAFGIKLWIIARYANPTPFWDEWDAQAANLFVPFLDHQLSLQRLFEAHNEHRLFTTRIVSLALFAANGVWDPVLQMIVNAAIHVVFGVTVLLTLGRHLSRPAWTALALVTFALVAVPNASESLLMGIQTHFYCAELFGFLAIVLMTGGSGFSLSRMIGLAAAALSFFSLASGALVFLACGCVVVVRRLLGATSGWREWFFAAVLVAGFGLTWWITPTIAAHGVLRSHTLGEFITAFSLVAGWPLRHQGIAGALLVNAPWLLLAWRAIRDRPCASSVAWVLLALGLWDVLQFAALGFGRAVGIGAPRYLDISALGLIVNFVCAVTLARGRTGRVLTAIWVAVIAGGWFLQTLHNVPHELEARYRTALAQERNVKSFLADGKFPPGASGNDFTLPYPDEKRLAEWLSDPRVRGFLPSTFQAAAAGNAPNGDPDIRRDRMGRVRDDLLKAGPWLAASGLLLLILLLIATAWAGLADAMRARGADPTSA